MTRIVLDAMGSDNYPTPDVVGAVLAAREYGVEIILVGDEAKIRPLLASQNADNLPIRVVHAPEMLTMEDKGMALALKARRPNAKNSMAVGIDLVKNGEADAFVTAGNTGAAMATAYFRLGTIEGVDLPALAPVFPTATGSCVVLDIGANPEVKPENLYQFAILGSIYAERVRGVKHPKVGLISNGEEEGKGNENVKKATPLLKQSGLNFVGNVEGKEVIGGKVDVAVIDGFAGNIMLKTAEAVAKLIVDKIREAIKTGGPLAMLGGLLVKPALGKIKKLLDPSEEGAAPLLGVNGLVFIGHGRSDEIAIKNAIRVAKHAVEANVLQAMRDGIRERLSK
ncbi:MAG: phosphate acyltransferase PlsX [Anaerolineae bacterium]|nr:MAG: phosphate acyltransferase PlsX [Anaerolineae bacterium]